MSSPEADNPFLNFGLGGESDSDDASASTPLASGKSSGGGGGAASGANGGADLDPDGVAALLEKLAGAPELLFRREHRRLRKALVDCHEVIERRKFAGKTKEQYREEKLAAIEVHSRRKRMKARDKQRINNSKLRKGRREHLAAIAAAPPELLLKASEPNKAIEDGSAAGAAEEEATGQLVATAAEVDVQARNAKLAKPFTHRKKRPMYVCVNTAVRSEAADKLLGRSGADDTSLPKNVLAVTGPEGGVSRSVMLSTPAKVKDKVAHRDTVKTSDPADFVETKQPDMPGQRNVSIHDEGSDSDEWEEEPVEEDAGQLDLEDDRILAFPRSCYICKRRFHRLHHFYDQLCPKCAKLNWAKRNQSADLTGRVALLTGGRVKIGFECGLKLLRSGAVTIVTTRFPHDAAERYGAAPDFEEWKDRLHIYGLDMRDLRSVVRFTDMIMERYERLDVIVNNAAQTIRRPAMYYRHLMRKELTPTPKLPERIRDTVQADPHLQAAVEASTKQLPGMQVPYHMRVSLERMAEDVQEAESGDGGGGGGGDGGIGGVLAGVDVSAPGGSVEVSNMSALLSQLPVAASDLLAKDEEFPEGHLDVTGQQLDLRRVNSWLLLLHEVEPAELVEVFAINALSPFIINSRLKHLMSGFPGSPEADKFIVNVSAMEGMFYRHKDATHPHTNMAKAALNMMTRTSAGLLAAESRIFMNSVDTGWINPEADFFTNQRVLEETNFDTPIDEVDAAARILDPVFVGYRAGICSYGSFLKDYHVSEW